jgi:hypothetical protein
MNGEGACILEKFFKPVLLLLIFWARFFMGLRIMPADLAYWRIIGLATETEKARNGKKATTLGRCFKFEEQKPRS